MFRRQFLTWLPSIPFLGLLKEKPSKPSEENGGRRVFRVIGKHVDGFAQAVLWKEIKWEEIKVGDTIVIIDDHEGVIDFVNRFRVERILDSITVDVVLGSDVNLMEITRKSLSVTNNPLVPLLKD